MRTHETKRSRSAEARFLIFLSGGMPHPLSSECPYCPRQHLGEGSFTLRKRLPRSQVQGDQLHMLSPRNPKPFLPTTVDQGRYS